MRKSVLLLPAVAVLLYFFIVPVVLTAYYSFTDMALSGSNVRNLKSVSLENYRGMLTDPSTITTIRSTLVFLAGSLAGQTTLGFTIIYSMKQKARAFRNVVGPCFPVGWVVPEIAAALCFMAFLKESGTLNVLLGTMGIKGIAQLCEHPMLSVVIANTWHGTAFSMLDFQPALGSVSGEIEETVRVDDINRLQVLIRIIVPCVRDSTVTNVMLNTPFTLGVYGLIYAMTGGSSANKATTLPIYIYNQELEGMQSGFGTTIGMLTLLVGIVCSPIYARVLKPKDQRGTWRE